MTVWRKSSFSGGGTDCVEVATLPGDRIAFRDSKNPRATMIFHRSLVTAQLVAVTR